MRQATPSRTWPKIMDAPDARSKKPSTTKEEGPLDGVVFFIDRCLGKAICERLRAAGLTVEHKDDYFPQNTEDEVWMPEVGERGWVVLTRDTRIRFHPNEQRALLASNLRLFSVQTKRGPGGRRGVTGEEMAN